MMIKVINEIGDGMQEVGQGLPTNAQWYDQEIQFSKHSQNGNYTIAHGNRPFGKIPTSRNATQPLANTRQNLPGFDTNGFDSTNIHLHGLEVEPHLFYPQGTSNADAEWISIDPNNHRGRQCHCYHFHVASTQSIGTFFWHIHRHGTSAMQSWNGMLGLLLVVPPKASAVKGTRLDGVAESTKHTNKDAATHNLDYELASLGVVDQPFVMWDLALKVKSGGNGTDPKNVVVTTDQFLGAQSNGNVLKDTVLPFLVDDEYQPFIGKKQKQPQAWLTAGGESVQIHKYLHPDEPLRLRIVCASTDNICGFRIRKSFPNGTADPNGEVQAFYHIASDGFAFDHAVQRKFLILGGGQREDVVVALPQNGQYSLWQQGLGNIKFFGLGPGDQLLAQVLVAGNAINTQENLSAYLTWTSPTGVISHPGGHFTPGVPKSDDIQSEEVQVRRRVVFDTDMQLNRIPFQQYGVNGKAYDVNHTAYTVRSDELVEEWDFHMSILSKWWMCNQMLAR